MWPCRWIRGGLARVLLAVLVTVVGSTSRLPGQGPAEGRQRTPVGKLESAKGTLLSRAAPQAKWQVVDAGGDVYAGDLLVGMPGAVVTVQGGAVALAFQTDFDSPFPVL